MGEPRAFVGESDRKAGGQSVVKMHVYKGLGDASDAKQV